MDRRPARGTLMDEQTFFPPVDLTREDLDWAEAILRRRIGQDAEEYAGIGLMRAHETFDPARGIPWRAWAAKQIVWTARDEQRKLDGRVGSAAYESRRNCHELQEFDEPATDERGDEKEERSKRAINVLRDLDQKPDEERLIAYGRIMASMKMAAVRKLVRKRPGPEQSPLLTRSYSHLVDALMLFGAQLEPCHRGSDVVRINIARTWTQRRALFFGLVLCHKNGIRMRLRNGPETIGEKICYSSLGNTNFREDFLRWYPHRAAVTPNDLDLDELKLMIWAVGSLAFSTSKRMVRIRRLKLAAPRLSRPAAMNLASQIQALKPHWKVDVLAGQKRYSVVWIDDADEVQSWLSAQIPETTWSRTENLIGPGDRLRHRR